MRSVRLFAWIVIGLAATCGRVAYAVDFESFNFGDSNGTELDFAANTANPGNMWVIDVDNLFPASVENGVYKITKENINAAPAVLNTANVSTGSRFITVDMAGWAFRGFVAGEPEELRFGFLDNDDGMFNGNLVTAQMQIARNNTTQAIELRGDAIGAGASNISRVASLGTDQAQLFKLVLQLDKTSNSYEVFYKNGTAPSQSLGLGAVSPQRNGNSVRLFVNNNFGSDASEFISVDRIAVSDANPLTDLLTLEVNRNSGELKLINTTGAVLNGLESYSILSASGSLNPGGWKTIAANYDSDNDKSVDVDNTWAVGVSNFTELTESVTGGNGGILTNGQPVVLSMGTGAWVKNPIEDLYMELRFAGGVTRSANVNFVGNGGERYELGDLNFDGSLTGADWLLFVANSETDLSGLSGPQRYQRGDFDGDGVNSVFDFATFKNAYAAANGVGSFEAMLAAIPEPGSAALAGMGALAIAAAMRRRCMRMRLFAAAVIAAYLATIGVEVRAGILQDFTFSDANGTTIDAAVNSVAPGNMWLSQNTTVESSVFNGSFRIQKASVPGQVGNTLDIANVTTGKAWLVAEIAGWSYTATPSGTSERVRFGFLDNTDPVAAGSNTITAEMTIDRGTSNDLILSGEALGTGFSAISADYSMPLVRSTPLTMVLELDKGADQYSVYYKDGAAAPFVQLGTGNLGASTLNPGDRDGNSIRFAFTGLFNDTGEFFDVNRIYVTDTSPLNVSTDALTLRVNRTTGATSIVNTSATAFNIDLYRIESPTGRLNAANSPFWNSLSDQNFGAVDGPDVGSTAGDGIGETWDEAGGSDASVLAEMFLLGSSNFAAGTGMVDLGRPYVPGAEAPLMFQYRSATSGALLTGNVEFVTGGAVDNANFDGDGDIDGADFLAWQRGFGTTSGATLAGGDAQGDGDVDGDDFAVWRRQFGEAPAAAAIPEPTAALLAATCLMTIIANGANRLRRRGGSEFAGCRES